MIAFAVIPARGGSRGIARKNLQHVGGQSLLARAISTCTAAGLPVYVSTEDAEIAEHAYDHGAITIDRPSELATDTASTEAVIEHTIGYWRRKWRANPDRYESPTHIVTVQCTAPFLEPDDINRCVIMCSTGEYDSSFAASRFHGKVWRDVDGSADPVSHDKGKRVRRQDDAFHLYLEAGSVYCTSVDAFIAESPGASRFAGRCGIVEIDESRCFEIDAEWQLERARRVMG